METYLLLKLILLIIAIIINIILGLFIYLANRKSATHFLFFLLSWVISFWLLFNYLSVEPKYIANSLLLIRFSIFFAAPMSVLFLLLAQTIPQEKLDVKNSYLWLIVGITLATMATAISPYAFKGVVIVNNSLKAVPGPGLLPFALLSTLSSVGAVYILVKKHRQAEGIVKEQLRFMMLGIIAMLSLIIVTIFVPAVIFGIDIFVPFLPIYTLIFLGMTGYAIIKHHLFNIKVIATEAFATLLWIVLFSKMVISPALSEKLIDFFILATTIIFGGLLIKSVRNEVQQREQLEILDKKLEAANDKLKVLDQARAEFITIASHQLRTPPATIKWYLSSISDGDYGKLTKGLKAIIEKATRTNNSQISLIDDLLNVSRIERGKMEFLFQPTDLEALAKTTIEQLEPMAEEKGLKLIYIGPKEKLSLLMADKEKLRQVMNNLIDNSLKYTKQGSVTVSLSLSAKTRTPQEIKFSVTDTGKGISPEDREAIFGKFSRGKESIKQSSGLGLGLYVAKVVIEQHKGKIWAESNGEGKGSSFIFTVPVDNGLRETTLVDLAPDHK